MKVTKKSYRYGPWFKIVNDELVINYEAERSGLIKDPESSHGAGRMTPCPDWHVRQRILARL